jgi:hypothetical protein
VVPWATLVLGPLREHLKQHSVDGVAVDHCVVRPGALVNAIDGAPAAATPAGMGAWLALHARQAGLRVVYSPIMRCTVWSPSEHAVSPQERALIAVAAGALADSGGTRSRWLSLTRAGALTTEAERTAHLARLARTEVPPVLPFEAWLRQRIDARRIEYPMPARPVSIAVITPVYERTDTTQLQELAGCLLGQGAVLAEWIIGVDGPIAAQLRSSLQALGSSDARVRVVELPKGGIVPTLRACLAATSSDYVLPVDADDVLTEDALQVLAAVIDREDRPDLVYSDEAVLDGAQVRDPYLRPSWDPVLHLASSYAWHAICYSRTDALDAGLYADPAFEWCQDWDTVERIRRRQGRIVHVPEVLYAWRRHEASSTHSARPTTAQESSVRAMFSRFVEDRDVGGRFEVAPFPIWRGAPELHLRRLPCAPPDLTLVTLGEMQPWMRASLARSNTLPFAAVSCGPSPGAGVDDLRAVLDSVGTALVATVDGSLVLDGDEWLWEAVKWFELLDDVGVVCGRLVDGGGQITAGAEVLSLDHGAGEQPLRGLGVDAPGPYALALKPHTIDKVDLRLAVGRTVALRDALGANGGLRITAAGWNIASSLGAAGVRTVFDPLLTALAPRSADPHDEGQASPGRATTVRGLAAFAAGRRQFR